MKNRALPLSIGLSFAFFSATAIPGFATSSDWQDIGGGRMRMVIADPALGDTKLEGMIELDLLPGWRTYWKAPGDGGVPPQISVTSGAQTIPADIAFPTPEWHITDYGANAGYSGKVQLPVTFEASKVALPVTLRSDVFLGVCESICIPVTTNFELQVAPATTSSMDQISVAAARAALPKKLPEEFAIEVTQSSGNANMNVTVTGPTSFSPDSALFVHDVSGKSYSKPQIAKVEEGSLTFSFHPSFTLKEARETQFEFVLHSGSDSWTVPLSFTLQPAN